MTELKSIQTLFQAYQIVLIGEIKELEGVLKEKSTEVEKLKDAIRQDR